MQVFFPLQLWRQMSKNRCERDLENITFGYFCIYKDREKYIMIFQRLQTKLQNGKDNLYLSATFVVGFEQTLFSS